MLYNGHGWDNHLMGRHNHRAYPRFMKFSVAPESSNAVALALFAIDRV